MRPIKELRVRWRHNVPALGEPLARCMGRTAAALRAWVWRNRPPRWSRRSGKPGEEPIRPLRELDGLDAYGPMSGPARTNGSAQPRGSGISLRGRLTPAADIGTLTALGGKPYKIVTMRLEAIYRDAARFAENDPEHFDWIVANVIRRGLDNGQ